MELNFPRNYIYYVTSNFVGDRQTQFRANKRLNVYFKYRLSTRQSLYFDSNAIYHLLRL